MVAFFIGGKTLGQIIDFEHKKNVRLALKLLHTMKELTDKVLEIVNFFETENCYFMSDEIEGLVGIVGELLNVEIDRELLFQFLDNEIDAEFFIKYTLKWSEKVEEKK